MKLIVKANHFECTEFAPSYNCALTKAAKEQFSTFDASEWGERIRIKTKLYNHIPYTKKMFKLDKIKAFFFGFSDHKIIRKIELITP